MGKGKPLTEVSLETLQGQQKVLIGVLLVMLAVALASLATYVYFLVYRGESNQSLTLQIIPFLALTTTSLPLQMRLGAIRKEIARRNG
jgi:hypothetical protein